MTHELIQRYQTLWNLPSLFPKTLESEHADTIKDTLKLARPLIGQNHYVCWAVGATGATPEAERITRSYVLKLLRVSCIELKLRYDSNTLGHWYEQQGVNIDVGTHRITIRELWIDHMLKELV